MNDLELLNAENARLTKLVIELRAEAVRLNAQAVPDGWQLVPLEPTPEMLQIGRHAAPYRAVDVYRAMIAAAPAAPQPAAQQGEWDIDAVVKKSWERFQAALEQDEPLPPPSIHTAAHYGTWLGREAHRHAEPKAGAFRNAARMLSVLEAEVSRLHAELIAAQAQEAAPSAPQPAQQPLTDEQCDAIYMALDNWAREFDEYEFGLPHSCGGGVEGGREIIRNAISGVKND